MTINLTFEYAKQLLVELVEEKGEDFMYDKPAEAPFCYYWHGDDNAPGCIVGHLLIKAGVSVDDLQIVEGTWASAAVGRLNELDENEPMFHMELKAGQLLDYVQERQDNGSSWGSALRRALEDVGEED